jgi:hypothetical protein
VQIHTRTTHPTPSFTTTEPVRLNDPRAVLPRSGLPPSYTNTESTCATIPSESTLAATSGGSPPSGAGTTPLPTRGVSRTSPTLSTGQRSYAVCNCHAPGACQKQYTDMFVQASASRRSTRHGRTSSSAPSSRPTKWPTPFSGERERESGEPSRYHKRTWPGMREGRISVDEAWLARRQGRHPPSLDATSAVCIEDAGNGFPDDPMPRGHESTPPQPTRPRHDARCGSNGRETRQTARTQNWKPTAASNHGPELKHIRRESQPLHQRNAMP